MTTDTETAIYSALSALDRRLRLATVVAGVALGAALYALSQGGRLVRP